MKIGVDVDGVLAAFVPAYITKIIEVTGRNPDIAQLICRWTSTPVKFSEALTQLWFPPRWGFEGMCGYTREEIDAVWRSIQADPMFWYKLEPLSDALDAVYELERLTDVGHDVYYITHRDGRDAKSQTELWLMQLGAYIPTVLLTSQKAHAALTLGLDIYIDDRLKNANSVAAMARHHDDCQTRVYLKATPYNITEDGFERDPALIVVDGVEEMLRREGLA